MISNLFMKSRLADKERLIHILEAIDEIKSYIKESDLKEFLGNSMMRYAAVKQVEIIGEAANHLPSETRQLFSEIEWPQIVEMRNILVHEYFGIDFEIVADNYSRSSCFRRENPKID